jgi:hypothetical protein
MKKVAVNLFYDKDPESIATVKNKYGPRNSAITVSNSEDDKISDIAPLAY